MTTTHLRKVGGSTMLVVPPAFLNQLELKAGDSVGVAVSGKMIVINAKPKLCYTLSELISSSDYSKPQPKKEREWVDAPTVGDEIL